MPQNYWTGGASSDPTAGGNWSTASAPAAGEDVIVPASATVNMDGGDIATGAELESFTVEDGCTITIGSATSYLQVDLASGKVYRFGGTGISYIQPTGVNATYRITNAATQTATGSPGLWLRTGEATSGMFVDCSSNSPHIGLAATPGDTGVFNNIQITAGTVTIGAGATITNLTNRGGVVNMNVQAATSFIQFSGTTNWDGAGTNPAITVKGGVINYSATATVTALVVNDPGSFVILNSPSPPTITNADLFGNDDSEDLLVDIGRVATYSNPVSLNGCSTKAANFGTNINLTPAALS